MGGNDLPHPLSDPRFGETTPMVRRMIATVLLACMALGYSAGCATLSMSSDEHREQVRRVARHDWRALQDDLDLLFMTDRTTRLTRWHDR